MRIALLNFSGNVGKTTLARDVLKMRLPTYELISVESVNSDDKEDLIIKGENRNMLLAEIALNDNLILDIGSSNLEAYFISSSAEQELLSYIDIFIIPTTPETKPQVDTAKTVRSLNDLFNEHKIKDKKIFIVANQVELNSVIPVEEKFEKLKTKMDAIPFVDFNLECSIEKHDLYSSGKSLAEMFSDEDYKELMEDAKLEGDREKARKYAYLYANQKNVQRLNDHYQFIFNYILGDKVAQ